MYCNTILRKKVLVSIIGAFSLLSVISCGSDDDGSNSNLSTNVPVDVKDGDSNIEEDTSQSDITEDVIPPSMPVNDSGMEPTSEPGMTAGIPVDYVLAYDFDNTIEDKSKNNHKVKSSNVNFSLGRKGTSSSALSFNSDAKNFLAIEHSEFISLKKEMTMSLWFYYVKQENNSFYTIIEKSNPDDGGHSRYGMWVYNAGIIEICIEPDTCPESLCQECLDTKTRLEESTWNHLVGTFDGSNLKLYLNGKENASRNIGFAGISQTAFELFFGADQYNEGVQPFLNGKIDDFRLYDRALSSDEVVALFKE